MRLSGLVGKEEKEFVYEFTFPERTNDAKDFVEHLWARRKVGYLLDQIRANGQKTELVEEVTKLAKKYGITTPYTSYLIVPDAPTPVARGDGRNPAPVPKPDAEAPSALAPAGGPGGAPVKVTDFAKEAAGKSGGFAGERDRREAEKLAGVKAGDDKGETKALEAAKMKKDAFDEARRFLASGDKGKVQAGRLGVDLALEMNNLRNQ